MEMWALRLNTLLICLGVACATTPLLSCGPPLKGKVLTTDDLGISDPSFLGLPENFPLNPPPDQLVVSPDPIAFSNTPIGFGRQFVAIVLNTYETAISINDIRITMGTDLSIVGGTCTTLPGDILYSAEYCEVIINFIPTAATTRTDTLEIDFDDGINQTLEVDITATGTL